ncbi:MAG: EamA family transporter [Novosphingobium sp.]|nr:EamA family transporter [Novosphingobium sp.]
MRLFPDNAAPVQSPGQPLDRPHALLRPRIAIPFVIVGLIWGSTWLVIRDQLEGVPPGWSVAWRFVLATPAMFLVALLSGDGLRMSGKGHALALFVGVTQFCGNYNFVYRAEQYLTSGIVAVMISLLLVPNTLLARLILGQKATPRFYVGSAIAIAGIALLLLHESRAAPPGGNVPLGIALALGGMIAASVSNVMQANETGRAMPMTTLIAWSMLYGAICDGTLAWAMSGPPVLPDRPGYWLGTAWLAIFGSVVTFPMYYRLIRELGAGRAAYNGIMVLVVAMILSTVFEGYRWSALAVAGAVLALAGLVIALRARNPVT